MHRVVEAMVDESGRVFLLEPLPPAGRRRALLVVLDEASPIGTLPPPAATAAPQTTYAPTVDRAAWSDPGLTDPSALAGGTALPPPAATIDPGATPYPGSPCPGAVRPATPPPATAGRYQLVRPLGRGGMGETFLAVDHRTGRQVCVKRMLAGHKPNLLAHEWRSLSRASSPYVVRFLDQAEVDGQVFMVMEYVDGATLAERWSAGEGGAGDLVWLGMCLFSGLADVHRHGVIHCDLKPQNILIEHRTYEDGGDPGWIPKIADFGLAVLDRRDVDGRATAEGRIAGTPAYMAPEQARGWMLSPACDVYAAGLILWECGSGRRAFDGDVHTIMLEKLSRTEPFRLEPGRFAAPAALLEMIERCTHPTPSLRPSAHEAAEAFAGVLRR